MSSFKLADFFTQIGFKIDASALDDLKRKAKEVSDSLVGTTRASVRGIQKQHQEMNAHVVAYQKQRGRDAKAQELREKRELRDAVKRVHTLRRERVLSIKAVEKTQRRAELERIRNTLNPARLSQEEGIFSSRNMMRGLGRFVGPIAVGFAGIEGIKDIFQTGVLMNNLESSFQFIMGSSKDAAEQIKFLNKEVDRLSISLPEAATAYKQLMASAKDRVGAKVVQDLFSGFSELSVVLGLTADEQHRAIRAISQMASKGKVTSEELVGQLAEAVPGAIKIFADALGIGTEELRSMMEAGNALAEDVLPKVAKHLKKVVKKEDLEKAMNSPARALDRMTTAYTRMLDMMGRSGAYDVVTGFLQTLTALLSGITPLLIGVSVALKIIAGIIMIVVGTFQDLFNAMDGQRSVFIEWASQGGILGSLAAGFLDFANVVKFLCNAVYALFRALVSVVTLDPAGLIDSWNFMKDSWNEMTIMGGTVARLQDTRNMNMMSYGQKSFDESVKRTMMQNASSKAQTSATSRSNNTFPINITIENGTISDEDMNRITGKIQDAVIPALIENEYVNYADRG